MKVLLIFPPQCRPLHPYLSLAIVKAELIRRGHECRVIDLNLRMYAHILCSATMISMSNRIRDWVESLDGCEPLEGEDALSFYRRATALVRSAYLIENIDAAVAVMHTQDFYDYGRFLWARKVIEEALDLYSSWYGHTDLGYSQLRMRYSTACPDEILAACSDGIENPFLGTIDTWAREEVQSYSPDVIGISIAFDEQLIPAFTLASKLRQEFAVPIYAGGSMVTRLRDRISRCGAISAAFDGYLPFESESQFGDLVDKLASRVSLKNADARDLLPDFSDYELDKYYLPEIVLPYLSSRGCSFGRCVYCSHYMTYDRYRSGSVASTVQHLGVLHRLYGCHHFHFVDEAMEARFAADLSQEIEGAGLDLNWMVFARPHKLWTEAVLKQAARGGCRRLIFGLDAATDRIQRLMDKGTNLVNAAEILRCCAEQTIAAQVNFIVGFPGETEAESRAIVDFVKGNLDSLKTVGVSFAVSNFAMVSESAWGKMSAEVKVDPEKPFAIYYAYTPSEGLDMTSAAHLAFEVQTEVDRLTSASRRYPLLREMAFLYNSYYRDEEPRRTDDFPEPSGRTTWLCHDLFALSERIAEARSQLPIDPEEYLSTWFRLARAVPAISSTPGTFGYRLEAGYSANTFELPIVEAFVIGESHPVADETADRTIRNRHAEGAY
ncbi:radical SAM protein [Thauera aminoaromatica]|nr:radical SAM protein [Thauera aminoaromatica]